MGPWSISKALQATDLRDYTSYYCTCHLFSLALGMFAMVTVHSGLSELTHAVLCISQLGCDEGKSLPMIPNPWWGGFSISTSGLAWASYPSFCSFATSPPTRPPVQPQSTSPPLISSYFLSQTDFLNCPFWPHISRRNHPLVVRTWARLDIIGKYFKNALT